MANYVITGVAIPSRQQLEERIQLINLFTQLNFSGQFTVHSPNNLCLCYFSDIEVMNPTPIQKSRDSLMLNLVQFSDRLKPDQIKHLTDSMSEYSNVEDLDDCMDSSRVDMKGLFFLGGFPHVHLFSVKKALVQLNPDYNLTEDAYPIQVGRWTVIDGIKTNQPSSSSSSVDADYDQVKFRVFNHHFDVLCMYRESMQKRVVLSSMISKNMAERNEISPMDDSDDEQNTDEPKTDSQTTETNQDDTSSRSNKSIIPKITFSAKKDTYSTYKRGMDVRPVDVSGNMGQRQFMKQYEKSLHPSLQNQQQQTNQQSRQVQNHDAPYVVAVKKRKTEEIQENSEDSSQTSLIGSTPTRFGSDRNVGGHANKIMYHPMCTAIPHLQLASHAVVLFLVDPLPVSYGGSYGMINVAYTDTYENCVRIAPRIVQAYNNYIKAHIVNTGTLHKIPFSSILDQNNVIPSPEKTSELEALNRMMRR